VVVTVGGELKRVTFTGRRQKVVAVPMPIALPSAMAVTMTVRSVPPTERRRMSEV
jgi:hypothetical protein